jgi:RNase P subunit RPR2
MPQHARNTPVCRNCDGFPVVAITTGDRADDGSRVLLRVVCLVCKGTGHTHRAALVRAGR